MTAWIKNWFSNMESLEKPILVDGIQYPTVENFYAASKTLDVQQKRKIATLTPSVAKKYARTLALRSDWEEVKFAIMLIGLIQKFSYGSNWHKELMNTRGEELLELNNWHDTVWGVPANIAPGGQGKAIPNGQQGNNWLGRLLMFLRDEPLLWQTIGNNAAEWDNQKYLLKSQEWLVTNPNFPPVPNMAILKGKTIDNGTLPSQRLKVVISGSRTVAQLPAEAISRIEKIMELGAKILIGDCFGADCLVQTFLKQSGYSRVTVYYTGTSPRNNVGFASVRVNGSYTERDWIMCSLADYGLAILKDNSPGTLKNIQRMPGKVRVIQV
ncbi:NADAR family protein [Planktothrix sp. FACHB-1355]|uniref:NADAR family protein n=1 Tax=Aerosakkonema funiforme FACHB-1375 TaxID=2949571 RepID=A0A926VB09_9CYAN|nr:MULTISPECIES: NADAR family protein [Oscillatoriales]MBD2180370.1 NADAR family protein [Aerosakkonema funiforme FACHB-1375]MBD3557498.1 NADAR family protein [Planktothrix sp. FACHB-1355]